MKSKELENLENLRRCIKELEKNLELIIETFDEYTKTMEKRLEAEEKARRVLKTMARI
jgi:hypothetical protein